MPYAGNHSAVNIMTIAPFAQPQLFVKNISDSSQLQDTIKKSVTKALSDPAILSDSLVVTAKNMIRSMTDSLLTGDQQQKTVGKIMQDSTSLSDTLIKSFVKAIQDNTPLDEILTRFAVKGITASDLTTLADHMTVTFGRNLADNTVLADFVTRSITFTGVIMENEPDVDMIETDDLTVELENALV